MLTIKKVISSTLHVDLPKAARSQSGEAAPLKVLVVDDHCLIRDALCDLLKELKADAIFMEAADGHQAVEFAAENDDIGLVLLDMNLQDRDGFTVLSRIRAHLPMASVVVLLDQPERATVVKALNLGARGVIPKSEKREILFYALQLVLAGGVYIPRAFLIREEPESKPADINLTDRQHDVFMLVMQGKSNKAICRELRLAVPTVKNHMTAILKSLNVSNRTEAVIAAGGRGWPLPRRNRAYELLPGSFATN